MAEIKDHFELLYHKGIKALARREYSQKELVSLLRRYSCNVKVIESVVATLLADGALSLERFADSVCHAKSRNYGARYISQLLKSHDIPENVAQEQLEKILRNEHAVAKNLLSKKLYQQPSMHVTKQRLFLLKKGFSLETIELVTSYHKKLS